MKRALLLLLAAASGTFAQEKGNVIYQTAGSVGAVAFGGASGLVSGAPYSATITNESVQTLADGTRIVQNSSGTTARDSEGRTRQDTVLPAIGTLSAANAPHLIFIHDPVAQTSYTLNLTEKTAQKMPVPPPIGNTI
jgi:2-C-methyl-D-erythritol 4-phosphate cytidylyltransferase